MPPHRSRRAEEATPTPTQTQRRRRDDPPEEDEHVDMDEAMNQGSGSVDQLAKGLVRYALSCERSRKPIKRQDINVAVLGSTYTRLFKDVFAQANSQLMDVFGMQLVELPRAEKVTLRQKRAAAASDSQSKNTSIWVLQTILPDQYRIPDIIGPSRPIEEDINREDSYVGLYTMVIALITIHGGLIPEGKLDRALRRMNADQTTPMGTKDKTLANMIKDGYIVKVKDTQNGGEETIDYIVGPRGKMEVGRDGVAQLIRKIFGNSEDGDELDKKIERTLQVAGANDDAAPSVEAANVASQANGRKRGRPRGEGDE